LKKGPKKKIREEPIDTHEGMRRWSIQYMVSDKTSYNQKGNILHDKIYRFYIWSAMASTLTY